MSIQTEIRERVAALSATMPQDADPYAEARAEQRAERALPTKDEYTGDPADIKVGMGVTLHTAAGGLRSPFTVIAVRRNGRELDIQRDETVHTGPNDFADYGKREFHANPNGQRVTVTRRKDTSFIEKGVEFKWYSTRYGIGYRDDWTDYSQ